MVDRRRSRGRPGYTLMELLIVVTILAVLAVVAMPQYARSVERSRAAEALNMLGQMRASQLRAKLETGAYVAQAQLDITFPAGGSSWNFGFTANPPPVDGNAMAVRNAGPIWMIEMDLTTGKVCSNNPSLYGVPNPLPC